MTGIADILDASPATFQLKEKKNDISKPTKNYLSKKIYEATALLKQYAEAVAPNKTDKFISQVLNSSNQNSDEKEQVSSEFREHSCAFRQSDSFGKTVILSLLILKNIQLISQQVFSTVQNI